MRINIPVELTADDKELNIFLADNLLTRQDTFITRSFLIMSDEIVFRDCVLQWLESKLEKIDSSFETESHFITSFFNWKECFLMLENCSLFSSCKLAKFFFTNGKIGTQASKFISSYDLERLDDCVLIFNLPPLDYATKKTKWFSHISSNSVIIEFQYNQRSQMENFVRKKLYFVNGNTLDKITPFIIEKCEGNFTAINNEIRTIKTLLSGAKSSQNMDGITALISDNAKYNPFVLPDIIIRGSKSKAFGIINTLKKEDFPLPFLLWMIADKVRKMNNQKFEKLLLSLHDVDLCIKGIIKRDPWIELERSVLTNCND